MKITELDQQMGQPNNPNAPQQNQTGNQPTGSQMPQGNTPEVDPSMFM